MRNGVLMDIKNKFGKKFISHRIRKSIAYIICRPKKHQYQISYALFVSFEWTNQNPIKCMTECHKYIHKNTHVSSMCVICISILRAWCQLSIVTRRSIDHPKEITAKHTIHDLYIIYNLPQECTCALCAWLMRRANKKLLEFVCHTRSSHTRFLDSNNVMYLISICI